MTAMIDRIWISLGIDQEELFALKARRFFYAGFVAMAGTSTCLLAGILANVSSMMVA